MQMVLWMLEDRCRVCGRESTTTREAGGLDFLAAALGAGKKRQKNVCASMLNLHRVDRTRFWQESTR